MSHYYCNDKTPREKNKEEAVVVDECVCPYDLQGVDCPDFTMPLERANGGVLLVHVRRRDQEGGAS